MLAIKLALKNLLGAGLRTWLNVGILSFSFVVIIFYNGMIEGWNLQARFDTQSYEIGNGQLWHPEYDPIDIYSYQDAHAPLSAELNQSVKDQQLVPILVTQATAYPHGRMHGVVLKGIDPDQKVLTFPSELLANTSYKLPAIIGKRMARTLKVNAGEDLLIRWRDKNGMFDAVEVHIVHVFDNDVPSVDMRQIWMPLAQLQEMMNLPNEATYIVTGENFDHTNIKVWEFQSTNMLLKELDMIIQSKKGGASVLYILLLAIALLAIFDTQVLAIFRRQKEIGTYIALGMTRWQVVKIFTVEGSMYSILAALLATAYGAPLFLLLAQNGIPMPATSTDMGVAIADVIYPYYSLGLIVSTILLVVISATIVSFLPARKIAKLKPTDALKGKIQ